MNQILGERHTRNLNEIKKVVEQEKKKTIFIQHHQITSKNRIEHTFFLSATLSEIQQNKKSRNFVIEMLMSC